MKKFFVLGILSSLLVGQMYAMSSPRKNLHNQEERIGSWWHRDDFKLYTDRMYFKPGQNYITLVRNSNIAISHDIMQRCLNGLSHCSREFCVDASKLIVALNKEVKPIFIQLFDDKYYALNITIAKYVNGEVNLFEVGRLKEALRPVVQQVARETLFEAQGLVYLEEEEI
jgi:hypothetical protein